ncbi:MAG: protein translocase subunit SecF, partial [Brooklawnia sp.]
ANAAINQVLVRSINTTIIAVLPVLAILVAGVIVLGGEGPLADLGLAMLIGMISGAYSSIFLATPMLAQMREREPEMRTHRASLEKGSRKTRAKVTAVATTSEVSAAGMPTVAAPSTGVLDYAQPEADDASVDEPTTMMPPPSGQRVQPTKSTRSARKK